MRPGSLFDAPDHFGFAPILADNGWEAQWQRRRHRKGVCTWGDAQAVCIRMEGSTSCSSFSASVLLLYQGGHLVLADGVLSTKILSSFRVGQCVAYCKPLGAVLRWESRETKRIRNVYETYTKRIVMWIPFTLKLSSCFALFQFHSGINKVWWKQMHATFWHTYQSFEVPRPDILDRFSILLAQFFPFVVFG